MRVGARLYSNWTEEELEREIARLDELIGAAFDPNDARAKCVRAYLKQMLKDKQDLLKMVRLKNREQAD